MLPLMSRTLPAAFLTALLSICALAAEPLSIDTPILKLLADARTRPQIEKHLPSLAKRLTEDQDAADMLGSSSPRELAADPHVRGITEEKLKALQADLAAAQKP